MNVIFIGRPKNVRFLGLIVLCLLCNINTIDAGSRLITRLYDRIIVEDGTTTNISSLVYTSYNHESTELLVTEPSCRKLCPKGKLTF